MPGMLSTRGAVQNFRNHFTNTFLRSMLLLKWCIVGRLTSFSLKMVSVTRRFRILLVRVKAAVSAPLLIHPYLLRLRSEFPDLLIVAYCDDVRIRGPPVRAIEAMSAGLTFMGMNFKAS